MTIDFWWVTAKALLLSRTPTPAASNVSRATSLSLVPSRRAGFSITRTCTPRRLAAITASSSDLSVNRNIRILRQRRAELMGSRMACAESSGSTINRCDMAMFLNLGCVGDRLTGLDAVQFGVDATARDQSGMRSLLHHDSVLQDDDLVGVDQRAEAVRDHDDGAPLHQV